MKKAKPPVLIITEPEADLSADLDPDSQPHFSAGNFEGLPSLSLLEAPKNDTPGL